MATVPFSRTMKDSPETSTIALRMAPPLKEYRVAPGSRP
jgi:hypothetical protein